MQGVLSIYQYASAVRPKTFALLSLIGLLLILQKIFKRLRALYKVFLRPKRNLLKRYGEDSWVLVTGSSDGIGKQFALSFAKRGFNVIITARTKSKLERVSEEIHKISPNSQVKIIVSDFTNADKQGFFDQFMNEIEDLDISVLVNNVGLEVVSTFTETKQLDIKNLITVNTLPITILSNRLIKRFLKRNKKSAIINLASSVSQKPMPGYHVYCASKAFDDYLSRCLAYEYPQIDIMSVRPSQVSTPMTFNKPTDILTITPEQCVQSTLRDLGYDKTTNGHINHKFQAWLISLFPERVFNFVFKNVIFPSFINERKVIEASRKKTE